MKVISTLFMLLITTQVFADSMALVKNKAYEDECGSCHMPYQAGFLPARSWEKIMTSLDKHFGENAELDAGTQKDLSSYLTSNAADHNGGKLSKKFLRSVASSEVPLRISSLPYFKKEHDEVPAKLVKNNDKVKSFSRCEACHRKALNGSYREREIDIPGHGKWED
ncbi:MAG: diheme cytochrome c [Gammaproteobacteria bacterium]|nr:diheme cytochrome c [Gammaproteobacteria bacterium]